MLIQIKRLKNKIVRTCNTLKLFFKSICYLEIFTAKWTSAQAVSVLNTKFYLLYLTNKIEQYILFENSSISNIIHLISWRFHLRKTINVIFVIKFKLFCFR